MLRERALRNRARAKGRNTTRTRLALLEILSGSDRHPTAAELYDEVRKVLPEVTLATVYRNLAVLRELGLIKEIPAGTSAAHYDAIVEDHCHVCCQRCGRVSDVNNIEIPEGWQAEAQAETNYVLTDELVLFRGICPDCQAEESASEAKREDQEHVSEGHPDREEPDGGFCG